LTSVEILDFGGNQVSWLNIDTSTGSMTGTAPAVGVNYTLTARLTVNLFSLDVPFFLNIVD